MTDFRKRILETTGVLVIGSIISLSILAVFPASPVGKILTGVTVGPLVLGVIGAVLVFSWRFGAQAFENLQIAATPIPGPAEISWALYQEWGRPPTTQEIAVVQDALINRRNEAAIYGAVSLGAIFLANAEVR